MEKYRPQPEQKQISPEGGQSLRSFADRQAEQAPDGGGGNTPERQPLPGTWDILEREVRLYSPHSPRMTDEEYGREVDEISRLQEEMDEKGTARDNLIRGLYWTTLSSLRPPGSSLYSFRHLSLEAFQQFRSRVDSLSEEEIAEEIRKQDEESDRQREEYRKRHRDDPPTTANF